MVPFDFYLFTEVIIMMSFIQRRALGTSSNPDEPYRDEGDELLARLYRLGIHLGDCGLPVSATSLCQLANVLEERGALTAMSEQIDAFYNILEIEIRSKSFFAMPSGLGI